MAWLAMVLSLVVALVGALGLVSPRSLLTVFHWFESPLGLYTAAGLRIVLGGALLLAAPTSRAPRALQGLGFVILVAGLITPFFGVERLRAFLDWWSAQGQGFIRAWCAVALAVGAFLAGSVLPRREAG
jgi:hypothetical protein